MRYKTPMALEMAVKAAAKSSSMDTGQAIAAFYFHRFLCRVFRGDEPGFVLKGGSAHQYDVLREYRLSTKW